MCWSHLGKNLADAFIAVLCEYGIDKKVSVCVQGRFLNLTFSQVLTVAADNVSANDVIIDEMSTALPIFPGEECCMHCFNHIINLVAKSLWKLFDVLKKSASGTVDDAEKALQGLAGDLDLEELQTQLGEFLAQGDANADNEDDVVDALSRMTDAERTAFQSAVALI
jgi:hypothetical protein